MPEYVCDLTRFMDKYLVGCTGIYHTYILFDKAYASKVDGLIAYPIRVPGATRGSVYVDDAGVIKHVELDPSTAIVGSGVLGCFSPSILIAINSMLGTKLSSGMMRCGL